MIVTLLTQSGRKFAVVDTLSPNSTIGDLKKEIQVQKSVAISRQRLNWKTEAGEKPVVLQNDVRLDSRGDTKECTLIFKDLGPQISWRTVFLLEYLGPMLVYPIFYLQPSFIYGSTSSTPNFVQTVALVCFMVHYLKREFETLFVHRFGNDTMPIRNLFKNSSYYWGNAIICGYFVNHPGYTSPSDIFVYTGLALFVICEIGNLHAHLILKNLRKPGTRERNIPVGGLFNFVSCANYFYEILAWVGWSLMVGSLAAWLFVLQGAYQMLVWAQAKHRRYRSEFSNYPRNRKALIPFVI